MNRTYHSSVVGYRITCRWLLITICITFALLVGVPIYSSDREHERYLTLRESRNALLDKELDLKKDKEDVTRDIIELTGQLKNKYRELDSICRELKETDLSIKKIERDML